MVDAVKSALGMGKTVPDFDDLPKVEGMPQGQKNCDAFNAVFEQS